MTCVLLNNSAALVGFLGGKLRGGFNLIPTVKTTLSDDHVERIKKDPTQARIMRALIDSLDVVDLFDTFADLPSPEAKVRREKAKSPDTFDSKTPLEVVQATLRERAPEVDLTPPAPAMTPALLEEPEAPQESDERAPVEEDAPPSAPAAPADLLGLSVSEAMTMIATEDMLETLRGWWVAETRPKVKQAIEDRGNAVVKPTK